MSRSFTAVPGSSQPFGMRQTHDCIAWRKPPTKADWFSTPSYPYRRRVL